MGLPSPLIARLRGFIGKKGLIKDSSGVFIGNMVNIAMGMLTSVILARSLAMGDLGRYQLLASYLAMAQIATLPGMNMMINKAAMKGLDSLFYPMLKRSFATSLAASLLMMGAGAYLHFALGTDLGMNLMIVGFFLPVLGFEKYDPVFLGKKRFKLSRQMSIYSSAGSMALIGATAYFTHDVKYAVAAMFVSRALSTAIGFNLARKCLDGSGVLPEVKADYLKQGWKQTFFTILGIVANQLDKVILGNVNVHLLAVYYIGAILPSRIKDNIKVLFGVTVVHWAALSKRDNFLRIKMHWPKIALFGALISGSICVAAPLLIPTLYGADYKGAVIIAQLLSLSLPLSLVSSFILNADIFQNRGNYNNMQSLFRQIGYLVLLAFLAPAFGYYGIIAAILAAETASGIASIFYFSRELKSV